ncbi:MULTISPECIES: hypothetical protein [Cryobacterium]|uniref:WxL domain-containing protein n=1 Tax=Cryobacterium mannosilyticum TaxID=1259190 RepID=A0A4R8W0J2_9MICO|nr:MULTISPECIES: hypothetical protein [Cryobacterium]TFB94616.1 hypothetical protein E3O48_08385 [Cryobacterium sp. HLT2-28]TFB99958.1 hypothetical protein E3O32_16095 [Cryobacterium mannosilyticum]
MKLTKKMRFAAVGIVSLSLVAGAAAVASAAVQTNGSDGPFYVFDRNIALVTDPTTVFQWNSDNFASGAATSYDVPTMCPIASTGASIFLSDVGSERTVLSWKATALSAFNPQPAVAGTKEVIAATLTPITLINGLPGQAAVKAAGGTYSLGMACTTNNGVTVVGAFYRTIHVTAGTGAYTVDAQADVAVTPTPTPTPTAPAGTTGDVALAPTVAAASNGVLSFSVPAGAAATFGAPTLVNNKSTTVGTLGAVTVADGRIVTRNGWDLTANVADFKKSTDAANTISNKQLGFVPTVTAVGTDATGVTAAAAQTAGTASYPAAFASGAAANTVGNTVLNAALTFVAPQEKAAGTYTSVMTLTVVSK